MQTLCGNLIAACLKAENIINIKTVSGNNNLLSTNPGLFDGQRQFGTKSYFFMCHLIIIAFCIMLSARYNINLAPLRVDSIYMHCVGFTYIRHEKLIQTRLQTLSCLYSVSVAIFVRTIQPQHKSTFNEQ